MADTEVKGWDEAIGGLVHIQEALRAGIPEALKEMAEEVVDAAQGFAPVRTGRLRDSIAVISVTDTEAIIGAGAPYAAFVEFGTMHMAARPFMRPALAFIEEEYGQKIFEVLNE